MESQHLSYYIESGFVHVTVGPSPKLPTYQEANNGQISNFKVFFIEVSCFKL